MKYCTIFIEITKKPISLPVFVMSFISDWNELTMYQYFFINTKSK